MSKTASMDAAFAVLGHPLSGANRVGLTTKEPFVSNEPFAVGGSVPGLTLCVRERLSAYRELTTPAFTLKKAGLIDYVARRSGRGGTLRG